MKLVGSENRREQSSLSPHPTFNHCPTFSCCPTFSPCSTSSHCPSFGRLLYIFQLLSNFWPPFGGTTIIMLQDYFFTRAGVSNIRPGGRMRPANRFNVAHEKIFLCYACGPRTDSMRPVRRFFVFVIVKNFFDGIFLLEKKHFFERHFFFRKADPADFYRSGPLEKDLPPCGP